jgi:NADH-quinone oxidoreductase E subunit
MSTATEAKDFAFTEENLIRAKQLIGRYPEGRQASAVLPLLDLAQRQNDNWASDAVLRYVADMLDMPYIRVVEVASFYTMINMAPVGRHLLQLCRTTPCWLRGADDLRQVIKDKLGIAHGETTEDGKFTLMEVECLGGCVNAPIVQVNDDFYEDLDAASFGGVLDALAQGEKPAGGSARGRQMSAPETGQKTLLNGEAS